MLKSCRNHTDVISSYVNSKYMRIDGGLTRADWKIAFEFMNFLKIFYAATLACSSVQDKFKKYFEVMPTIFIVVSVMDPRIKVRVF
ncbi:hypothetical protein RHMOL_Rhmol01G0240500 [Rhododendron molle]|uniref:Uncharacterized protein n=1 Tax=Rhododendron molle TaxID=49168 RepID=A0ACC0Q4M7_RHOML|nr:hypothetical protein RHMOL_Rhmol01G0240500 [Rhododendron molle]